MPSNMPSIIRLCIASFTDAVVNDRSTKSVTALTPISVNSCKNAPITSNVSQNTSPIIHIKVGIAVYFPVSTVSIFLLRICSLLSSGFITVFSHSFIINEKRISAIEALLSRPLSFSICTTICSIVSFSFWSSFKLDIISSSPSTIFDAENLSGKSACSAWWSIR